MSLRQFFSRGARARDRADEMRAHQALLVDELIARGRTPDQAEREARLAFGNPRVKLEEVEAMNRLPVFDAVGRDLRYALRVMRRTPAFTTTAIVTLALVIGACTAVFSLADAILVRALPYPDPDRLAYVQMTSRSPQGEFSGLSVDGAMWEAVRDRVPALDAAATAGMSGGANLVVGDAAMYVRQQRVSNGFFRVLGVAPALGREFSAQEDVTGGPALTVLGHGLWHRAFGGRADIIGSAILLRGEPFTVVGVMPAGFVSTAEADLWTPLRGSSTGEGGGTNFRVIARLQSGATWEEARGQLAAASPEAFRLLGVPKGTTRMLELAPMQAAQVAGVREPIVMLAWAVAAVLLIACVNLAALLLARGGSRAKEIATRMALGSGRTAVVRQLMIEAVVLALAGGALGIVIGSFGLQGLKLLGGDTFTEWQRVALDRRAIAATAGLSFLTAIIFGLVPALQASRLDVQAALAESGSRSVAGRARHWPRRLLVVAEVALGVVLLVTTGLLLRTFVNVRSLNPGFNPQGLVTGRVSLQDARYRSSAQINELFDRTLERLRSTPGVEAAAVSLELPYERLLNMGFRFTDDAAAQALMTNASYVTPGFLSALQLPLTRGRDLSTRDGAAAPPVVLVNETFARVYSRDRDPIGRRLRISGAEREIVGITGDVQQRESLVIDGVAPGPLVSLPLVLMPSAQTNDAQFRMVHTWFTPVWSVRTRDGSGAAALNRAVLETDPQLPVFDIQPMTVVMASAISQQRLLVTLVGVLAAAAVLLAAIGVHGLIAHAVAERRREFGIRLALGASPLHTLARVALGGVLLSVCGAALGGVLSLAAVRLVESFLWNVPARDPATYAGVALLLLVVSAVASVVPALRILRLDPATTLRL
jgi:predicted permease